MVQAPISVRLAQLEDLKSVAEATTVVNNAYRAEGGWTTEADIVKGQRCTEEDMTGFIRDSGKPNTLLFAFDEDNQVVGTVQIQPSHEAPNEAEIGLFSVSPKHQSRGIGGRLVRQAMTEMKTLGFDTATMHVLENRPEILTWYKKLGFKETGERIPFVWPEMLKVQDLHFLTLKKPLEEL
jgi:ribosomal protein S18 acetylase RimI-like enzyme